jgi:ferrous iron transport protein B
VIYGLVAAYIGPLWAIMIYLLNILVVVALGNLFARLSRGRSPGLILEIPDLRLPAPRTLLAKTWLSLKEFITVAWPVLIISSAVLAFLEWAGAGQTVNLLLAPLTVGLLGLPVETGMTLVFGILRKELTLVMLVQALGTADVGAVMTTAQLVVFTLFVVFYVPCLATIAAMSREVGWRDTLLITGLTVAVATAVAGGGRLLMALVG